MKWVCGYKGKRSMRVKNRKFLSLLLACMMVLSLLTSCGG